MKKKFQELLIENILKFSSVISILVTLSIVIILFKDTVDFFKKVSIVEFFTSTLWTPLFEPKHYGVLSILMGTVLIALLSSIFSVPLGLGAAVFLSEYANRKVAKILKPVLELLAGIPSIVYGYFALTFITPMLRSVIADIEVFNALSASFAIGIMTLPMVASLSEDAMKSVPNSFRYGAYALGATKLEVATKVVIPAAMSGIIASIVLAISRAIGETMIVAIAAGANPQFNLNPLKSVQTMTAYMVNVAMGDIQYGSIEYKSIFAVGSLLFLITFFMNIIARSIVSRYGRKYS